MRRADGRGSTRTGRPDPGPGDVRNGIPFPRVVPFPREGFVCAAAGEHSANWARMAATAGQDLPEFTPETRARLVAVRGRRLGPRRVKPALAALKIRGLSAYDAPAGHALPTSVAQIGRGHRTVGGGNLRAAIFGVNDGLVSNASLILGMVGAAASTGTVLATGIAGLLAGALSMAAGEFVSVRSQREMFEYQIGLEADELKQYPEAEAEELALIYAARGLPIDEARAFATRLVADPKQALDVLAREELGLNPDDLGSPIGAALFSFIAFTIGAMVPLLPFLVGAALPQAAYWAGGGGEWGLCPGARPGFVGRRRRAMGGGWGVGTYLFGSLIGVQAG